MDKELLRKHIKDYVEIFEGKTEKLTQEYKERLDLVNFYQAFTKDKILSMTEEDIFEYISKLWAMLIWGNKHYRVDKIIEENGLDIFQKNLAELVWGKQDIADRWDSFRKNIKGMGPAMISEILCKTHPDDFMLWNRRAYVGLNYLKVEKLPRHDYQLTGKVYKNLCDVCKEIAVEFKKHGVSDTSLLSVDYFIWEELQVEDNLSKIYSKKAEKEISTQEISEAEIEFIHDDIRDKLRDIGQWLGFDAKIEQKVSEGSKVDTIWEATIRKYGKGDLCV